jgi:filamentous hemagglutinin family protein
MKHHLISSQSWKKLLLPALVAGSLLALPVSTWATLPNTGSGNLSVIFGSATYNALGNGTTGNLNVTATTNNTVLGWSSFSDGSAAGGSLAAGDVLNFILPSSTSAILNQVTGGAATTLNGGTITSNGRVVLLNPTGITINNGTSISTASFYASTIAEPLTYFENNGILQVFTSTPPATVTTGAVTIAGGVQLATIGGTGTIGFAGNTVSVGGAVATVVNGNLYLESQSAGAAINVSAGAGTLTVGSATAGGNLTIMSNGGAVDLANGSNTTIYGTATISTAGVVGNGGVVTTNRFTASTAGTLSTINAGSGATGGVVNLSNVDFASIGVIGSNVIITDQTTNNIAIGTSTINGTLTVSSTGGSINNTGAVSATGNIGLTANAAGKSINFSTSGNVSFAAINSTGAGNAVTITGNGNLNFTAAVTSPTVSITTTGGTYTDNGVVASTKETISASGNVILAAEAAVNPLVSITSTGGSITQGGALNITNGTFSAPTITLTSANVIGTAILQGGGGSGTPPVQFTDTTGTLTIGNGTNVTGAATITNNGAAGVGNIALGAAAADTISFGSTLSLTATGTGAITTASKNVNVAGAVTVNTTNSPITLGAAGTTNSSFGQIGGASGTGLFTINESSATNLGTITTTGGLAVNSGTSIVNTGNTVVTASGGVTLSAGSAATPGSIQIGSSSANAIIPGTITLGFASGLTLWDSPGAALTVSTNAVTTETVATESIVVGDSSALTVNGGAGFGTLSFNVQNGSVAVTDPTSLILTNSVDLGTNAAAIGITASTGSITLGSGISLLGTGTTTFTANLVAGQSVADTANSPVNIYGPVSVTAKSIGISNNTANSFGPVTLSSSGSIAYEEGSNIVLGGLTASGSSGTVSLTSVTGSITQTGAVSIAAGYTAANFTAPLGMTLSTATNSINKSAPISITALGTGGNVSLTNVSATGTVLGNVNVPNGTFTVTTLASGGSITQASGTSIFEYGSASFTTNGAVVTLANSGNNFGGISIDTTDIVAGVPTTAAGAAASVRETGTNNYVAVTTGTALTSLFTAVDDTANIVETGNAGIISGGGASFTAKAGNITLNATGNNFSHIAVLLLTAPGAGNAAITDANTTGLILADGTNVGGNLTATETQANASITDSGSLSTVTVGGTLALMAKTAGTSFVSFSGDNSTFGAVEIQAGSGVSSLLDNTNLVLVPANLVNGPITLTSAGNITTAGTGGSNFNNSLELVASGSIVITNPVDVVHLTVDAIAGPTNLSFLSLTANLSSNAPVNLGNTTNYTKPSP